MANTVANPGDEPDRLRPIGPRQRKDTQRLRAFLDLVEGATGGGEIGVEEGELPLQPGQIIALLEETRIGALLPPEGNRITRSQIAGLLCAEEFGAPLVKTVPDRAFWRTTVRESKPGEPPYGWTRSLGIVMHHDYYNADRLLVVTGEVEIGMVFTGGERQSYRAGGIYLDGIQILIEEPECFKVGAPDVTEYVNNMRSLIQLPISDPRVPIVMHGIDFTGWDETFGDHIEP